MSKYIDADKLITEIERRKYKVFPTNDGKVRDCSTQQEQPEVNLEEEINRFWDSCIKHRNERGSNVIWSNKLEVEALARYFYELGLNARKEE